MLTKTLALSLALMPLSGAVIGDVRSKLSAGDLSSADAIVDDYYRANGENSEYAAAVAWLARGALMLNDGEAASGYLARAKALVSELLKTRRVEDDAFLESAAGAAIEVEARLLASRGRRGEALALLEGELPKWKTFPVRARIQKNLNLLALEGKPAPFIEPRYRGKPLLLFLWAHWCGDCKTQGPAIARIRERFGPRGLVILAPTRLYGAVPSVERPTPEQETARIEAVWKESYASMGDAPHPIDDAAMLAYGVSSTPTLVLVDRQGIVRLYRPYRMSDAELGRRIEALLARP